MTTEKILKKIDIVASILKIKSLMDLINSCSESNIDLIIIQDTCKIAADNISLLVNELDI